MKYNKTELGGRIPIGTFEKYKIHIAPIALILAHDHTRRFEAVLKNAVQQGRRVLGAQSVHGST